MTPHEVIKEGIRVCNICKIEKPLSDFALHKDKIGGRAYRCRICDRNKSAKYYKENKEKRAKSMSTYIKLKKFPEKNKARYKFTYAVKTGKIIKQPCEICGEIKAEAHHYDYSKPFDVIWLCVAHHKEQHRKQ